MSGAAERMAHRELEQRLADCAAGLPAIQLLVLFGSTARTPGGPARDVDVGVLLEGEGPVIRRKVEVALGRAAGRTLDLVLLDEAPPLLRFEIARDGVLLLERRRHAWTDFRARAMIDWWDWAPVARAMHAAAASRLRQRSDHGPV